MNYTPSQVAEMLHIPASTLRHYARHFTTYLSPQEGRKQRLYTDRDLLVFAQIKDLSGSNIPLDQIGSRLVIGDKQPDRPIESALALVPSIAAEIEAVNASTRSALALIEKLNAKVEQLEAEITEMKLPWYKKIFR